MNERLEKARKEFISEKPFKKTNEEKLFERVQDLRKSLKVVEKLLKDKMRENERLNDFIRRFLPAFPSQIKEINNGYILEQVKEELERCREVAGAEPKW